MIGRNSASRCDSCNTLHSFYRASSKTASFIDQLQGFEAGMLGALEQTSGTSKRCGLDAKERVKREGDSPHWTQHGNLYDCLDMIEISSHISFIREQQGLILIIMQGD